MNKFLAAAAFAVIAVIPARADADAEKITVCMPMAKAGWEAMIEVYDSTLAGKPKYEEAKRDPSEMLLGLAKNMASAERCAAALAMFGPDGLKALMLNSYREELAAGKYPRIFDE